MITMLEYIFCKLVFTICFVRCFLAERAKITAEHGSVLVSIVIDIRICVKRSSQVLLWNAGAI